MCCANYNSVLTMSWSNVVNRKTQQINNLCGCGYMLLDQQIWVIKWIGLTNQLEASKTHKWWSSQIGTKKSMGLHWYDR